ncbi:MAG: SAM-dependent methyltransferase [Firmicutes bacterium HGW-Firmicutes-12]|jgi:tRNA1Val (adenine37-N6)-methyltransferase|nr:MAG: SAM-dependent methyltransferase [Firmicutes bacterium HGW-Firmicutes-12]
MVYLKPDETLDDLLINELKIIQKNKGFRFTLDSILLAQFATIKEGDRVVDLGTGTGIIPLILSARNRKQHIYGVEIQEEMVEMACRSVCLNGLENKITIIQADIRELNQYLEGGSYKLVTANPPYWTLNEGKTSDLQSRAFSRHEVKCDLEDIVASASKLLNNQGRFALIHRSERLSDIFILMRQYKLEPRRVRFIHPFIDKEAQQVLVEARKNAPPDLKVLPPLIVYERPGKYSTEVLRWYGKEAE